MYQKDGLWATTFFIETKQNLKQNENYYKKKKKIPETFM